MSRLTMQLATIALWASAVAVRSVAFVTPAARITSARPSALRSTTAPRQDTWQSADLKRGSPADIAAVLAERGDTAEHRRYAFLLLLLLLCYYLLLLPTPTT